MTDARASAGIVQVLNAPLASTRASASVVQVLNAPLADTRASAGIVQVLHSIAPDARVSTGFAQALVKVVPDSRVSTGIAQTLVKVAPDARVSTGFAQALVRPLPTGLYVRSAGSGRAILMKWPDNVWQPVEYTLSTAIWTWTDPLSSLSTLTVGSGTWTINGGVLETSPGNWKIRSNSGIDTSKDVHIAQVEIKVTGSTFINNDNHAGIGFNASSFASGLMFAQLHVNGSTPQVQFLSDAVAWRNAATFTFTSGQWYKLRVRWNDATDEWTAWLDGTQMIQQTVAQTEAAMYPTFHVYRPGGSAFTVNYRNLSYWGGSTSDTQPPLSA